MYNLSRRGIEWDVLPWCRQQGIPVMAYSPIEQGRLLKNKSLGAIASQLNVTPAQVALSWLLHQENVVVIPKSSQRDRIQENYAALDITLSKADLNALDQAFPPPVRSLTIAQIEIALIIRVNSIGEVLLYILSKLRCSTRLPIVPKKSASELT
ncbi:MAG: aldo/keto reductase [Leptolyngbyaceae cyanobacterium CSU_1_3]|nr:aldo/keto reductase [Leptolyngbyaceae cyanobacterium CSU_1_3]